MPRHPTEKNSQGSIRHETGQHDHQHQLGDLAGLDRDAADIEPVLRAEGLLADDQRQRQQRQGEEHHRPDEQAEGLHQPHQVDTHHHRQQADEVIHRLGVGVGRVGVVEHQDAQRAQEVGQGQQQLIRGEQPGQKVRGQDIRHRYGEGQRQALPLEVPQEEQEKRAAKENRDRPG